MLQLCYNLSFLDHDDLFMRTMNTIQIFRDINAKHAVALNSMKMSSGEVKFPPLHEEVFDGRI